MSVTQFFIVPIGDYQGGLDPLQYSGRWADSLQAYIQEHWPGDIWIAPGYSEQGATWTEADVRSYLQSGLASTAPTDKVVVYWAGHADGDPLRLHLSEGATIHADDLADWMLNSPAHSILLLLDCCYSGNGVGDLLRHFLQKERTDIIPSNKCVSVIASSSPGQLSTEGLFVKSLIDTLKGGPPSGMEVNHIWLPGEDAVTPEQLAAAVNAKLVQLGATQRSQARILLGSPGRSVPRAKSPSKPAWSSKVITRDLRHVAHLADAQWTGELNEATIAGLKQATRTPSDLVAATYIECVVNGALLALSLDRSLKRWLPPVPSATFGTELRKAYRIASGVWLDFEWESTLDYAYAITQRIVDRSQAATVRSLLVFAMRLLLESNTKVELDVLYDWAVAHGVSQVAFSTARRDASKQFGETRLVIEFDPSDPFSHTVAPPRGLRAQLLHEQRFIGDSIEISFAEGSAEAAIVRLLDTPKLRGAFDAIDLVLPPALLLLDTKSMFVSDAIGNRVPVDRITRIHRRFSERLWDPHSVMTAQALYDDIVMSVENVRLVQPDSISVGDLYHHLRDRRVGAALATADASAAMEILIACVRATPITVWPITDGADVSSAINEYWPAVPEAIRNGRRSPEDHKWARGANLLCVWEDPSWLTIALQMSLYANALDEEGTE